ncbi:murein hydrolase activator EnvC [Caulobacter sp. HMWF009]|nr:peptidoglycan DD-metalloendopeptidase family protein [Caulobacter sp. HMWF009]PTS84205.1 peptidase M24 [Caulobacter sp. HMWF009]
MSVRRSTAFLSVLVLVALLSAAGVGLARQTAEQRARDRQSALDTRREIEDLRAELSQLDHARLAAGEDVDLKRARLEALNAREVRVLAALGRDRHQMARLLSALQLFRRDPPPALLVSPGDARDAVRAAILVRAMTPDLQRRADGYARQASAVGVLRREAAAAAAELFTAESVVADRKGEIERLIVEKTRLERAYAQQALAEASELRTLGALTDGLSPAIPTGPLTLSRPVPGAVTRRFGETLPAGGRSNGLAFRTEKGRAVMSPAAGTVEYAGALNGWGVVLILRAQGAYHVVLAGLDQVSVAPGQSVVAGTPVGRMAVGTSLDPELYLEVREDGAPADPARWLQQGSQ